MDFAIGNFIGGLVKNNNANIKNKRLKTSEKKDKILNLSTIVKRSVNSLEIHRKGRDKNFDDLDMLAMLGKFEMALSNKQLKLLFKKWKEKSSKCTKSNPFSSLEEQEEYYKDNFAHGNVVNPFKYRLKNPWLKYLKAEKKFLHSASSLNGSMKINKKSIIKPTHLKQGDISNCWLIASIATLVHHDTDLVKSLITVDIEKNEYIVHLVAGKMKIRLKPEDIKPNVVAKSGAAWAGILEAAVAKAMAIDYIRNAKDLDEVDVDDENLLDIGYKIIDNGNCCSVGVYYLTGLKTMLTFFDEDTTSPAMLDYIRNLRGKKIILANYHEEISKPGAPVFDLDKDGLVSEHAYSLIEQDDNDYYVFNPWGMYEPGTEYDTLEGLQNSSDKYNDGLFKYNFEEFIMKKSWIIYEILEVNASINDKREFNLMTCDVFAA